MSFVWRAVLRLIPMIPVEVSGVRLAVSTARTVVLFVPLKAGRSIENSIGCPARMVRVI